MNREDLHSYATNPVLMVPLVIGITFLFLHFQKMKLKNPGKNAILDQSFMIRNALFVGAIAGALVYFGRPLPGLEESIIVSPADF
jgi:hypothetical protein